MTAYAAVARLRQAFRDVPRPAGLFVRGTCLCCECQEHNQTLASHNPETITLNELGNPGWDPMCFASDEAFAYYLPSMVRIAFEHPAYIEQLIFHLMRPDRTENLSRAQAAAVAAAFWSWMELHLEKVASDWEITGEHSRFEEAVGRLEAAAAGRPFQPR